ncbi:hypothetical protein ACREYJ_15035 [Pseudomonas kribbensis]|uniref:hypothetical protein n=1 Tax=Pseudomonas kribbensis TaxID=1628086 RepID=UPI003D781FD6
MYEVYSDEKYNKDNILLPPELRGLTDAKDRVVIDYIAGMMDSFAAQEYERFFGKGSSEAIYFNHESVSRLGRVLTVVRVFRIFGNDGFALVGVFLECRSLSGHTVNGSCRGQVC